MTSANSAIAPEVSVIIANFNGGALFAECIDSIRRSPQTCSLEVIVVDDASRDDSSTRAKEAFPALTLIRNPENLGLTRSINAGIRVARGRFMLILDNDTTVLPGSIDALCGHLRENPGVGVAVSRLFNPDMTLQRTARKFPHPLNGLFGRRSLLTRLFPANRFSQSYMLAHNETSDTPYEIDWGSTASMMVRRETVERCGGLDEEFFVYWCDADWCHRIKRGGWQVACVPASRVIHNENLKANHQKGKRTRMIRDFHRGAWTYFRKNQLLRPYGPMGLCTAFALAMRAGLLIAVDEVKWRWNRLSASATPATSVTGKGK